MNLSKNHSPGAAAQARANLSHRQAFDSLLQSLSTDDAARVAFVADPVKVLESYGLEFDRDRIPKDLRLPSKETIGAARAQLESETDPTMIFFIIFPARRG